MRLSEMYSELFTILRDNGVEDAGDLVALDHEYMRAKSATRTDAFVEINTTRHPWATDVFECLAENWDLLDDIEFYESGLVIRSEKPYDGGFTRDWNADDGVFAARASYACLFPKRMLYQSAKFRSDGSGWCTVPLDFLTQLFALRPALLAELCVLMPPSLREDSGFPGTRRHADNLRWELSRSQRLYNIAESGRNLRTLPAAGPWNADTAMVRTPWLFGLDLDTYTALACNEETFFVYSRAISRLLGLPNDSSDEVIRGAVEEVAAAVAGMNRVLEAESRSMRWKQGGLALGAATAIGAFLGPGVLDVVAGLTGSATVIQAGLLVGERARLRLGNPADDYWLIWASQPR